MIRYPEDDSVRSLMVQSIVMENPWSTPERSLPVLETRLRRARVVAQKLVTLTTSKEDPTKNQIQVETKLGVVLQRLGRLREAEAAYVLAIELAGTFRRRSPHSPIPLFDRITIREILGSLLIDQDRKVEAGRMLDGVVVDIHSIESMELGFGNPDTTLPRSAAHVGPALSERGRRGQGGRNDRVGQPAHDGGDGSKAVAGSGRTWIGATPRWSGSGSRSPVRPTSLAGLSAAVGQG